MSYGNITEGDVVMRKELRAIIKFCVDMRKTPMETKKMME